MKPARFARWLLQAWIGFVLLLSTAVPATAHNCSSQSDCEDTAGYLTAVSAAGGMIAILSGLLGASVASTGGTPPPGEAASGSQGPPGGSGPPLIDPDTNEPLIVQDGTYEGGEIGQVWSPFGGWVDRETAIQDIRERQAELGVRQREIDEFNRETDRQSEERARKAESEADAADRARAEAQARSDKLDDLRRRGQGLVDRVDDPVRAQELEDFLDRHGDDPDALERAIGAVRSQTFEADQQRTIGESEVAGTEAEIYGRSEAIAAKIEAAAKAGIAATGGAMLAAGAATAAAVQAGAAATGVMGGFGAGSESYQRGDSWAEGVANVAAGAAVGATEGAVAVGAQATSGVARTAIRMVGGGAADFADHLRRTGKVGEAAVQGAIGVVFGATGVGDPVMPTGGLGGAAVDAAAASLEGGLRASASGGTFSEGAEAGLTNWAVGRGAAAGVGRVARGASGTGFSSGPSSSDGPDAGGPAPGPSRSGDAGDESGSAVRPGETGPDSPPSKPAGEESSTRPRAEAEGESRTRSAADDLEAFVGEQARKGGSTDLETVDANDPRNKPDYGGEQKTQQGRGASAEETNRREVWMREDGTRVVEPNPEDSLGPTESRIRIDPDTGEARVVHGPKVPDSQKTGIEARLLDRNKGRIEQTMSEERARNTRIQAQQELEAARARLREAEARVKEADDRLTQTPEDSDDFIPKYGERADAQNAKTAAERAEIEARIRAMDAEEGLDPNRPRFSSDDDDLGGGGPAGPRLGEPDAQGRYDLDADAATDPLGRYATGEPIPGFVPQVRPMDCSVAVMTKETGLNYEDTFQNMKDFLRPERDASGNLQYGGLPPENLGPAMQRMGIAGDRVTDVLAGGGDQAVGARLQAGERMMVGLFTRDQGGKVIGGHAIMIDGIRQDTAPDGTTSWVLRGIDPTRGRIEIPATEARRALGGFQHAHFVKHKVYSPGGGGTP